MKRGDPEDFLGIPPEAISGRDSTFRHWMEGVEGGKTLNMLHIELPHTPWWYDPQGRQYTQQIVIPELDNEVWTKDPKPVAGYQARYLDQVEFVDRLVGELRATLERKRIWDRALVVFVADHGGRRSARELRAGSCRAKTWRRWAASRCSSNPLARRSVGCRTSWQRRSTCSRR